VQNPRISLIIIIRLCMKAMILAAGFGTRLFPLTIDRTKPAIPFLGKPLVGYVAEYIAKFGITDVVVNLHHQPQSVIAALGDGSDFGVNIEYTVEQPEILGTAGALDFARKHLENDTFVIVNGKIITDIDIGAAIETHKKSGSIATMVLKENHKREKFTVVHTKEDGSIDFFGPHATPVTGDELRDIEHDIVTPLMFTGIHILEPEVLDLIPRGVFSDTVTDIYIPYIKSGGKIAAHVAEGEWFELSTIPRYLDISLSMMGACNMHFGQNCKLSGAAGLRDSIIWDDVTIGDGASLYRTIIADGVTIGPGEHFENAAIVRADMVRTCNEIPEKALKGYVQGENYIVPLN
jgi:NDP-sugar pyrophosphorylase family protein